MNIQGDPPIVIKFWMSISLLKTKQEIIFTKCCANNSFNTIKHCNWPIETHYFGALINFLGEFFTKIQFRSVEKYSQPYKRQTVTEPTSSWKPYHSQLSIELPTIKIGITKITEFSMSLDFSYIRIVYYITRGETQRLQTSVKFAARAKQATRVAFATANSSAM